MRRLAFLVPILAALSACTAEPLRYAPFSPPAEVLPKTGLPKLFIEKVGDETDRSQLYVHHSEGEVDDLSGAAFDPGVSWPLSVHDALTLELKRLGWETTTVSGGGSEHLKATVVEARADWSVGDSVRVDGNIRIKLVLKDAAGRELWRGGLEGDGDATSVGGSPESGIREAWTAALSSAITSMGPILVAEHPWTLTSAAPIPGKKDKKKKKSDAAADAAPTGPGKPWWDASNDKK